MLLRVLFVEDSENDAALLLRELKRLGYKVETERVETADTMRDMLRDKEWDLIICDYSLPSFDAPKALEILQASGKDLPFIILSGTIGEETAVAVMKAGAHDFLLKDNLTRLGPVIERELREAEIRRKRKQAEEEVVKSEKRFRALIENSADYISLLAPNGNLLWESPSTTTMLGYAENEFLGRNILEIVHPDDLPWVQEKFAKLIATPGGRESDSFRLRHHNGSWRWVDAVATNLLNEPSVQAIVTNYHDVTERKQAEEAVHRSEEFFREVTENSSDIILIVDQMGIIKYASPSIERVCGYNPQELIGRRTLKLIHPEDQERASHDFGGAILTKDAIIPNSFRVVSKDGSEHLIEGVGRNLLDHPAIQGFVMNVRDVTERRQAEEKIKTILRSTIDGFYLVNMEGRILDVNDSYCSMIGYSREELLKMSIRDVEAAETEEIIKKRIERIRKNGSDRFETKHKRKDGTVITIEASVNYLNGEGGNLVVFMRDITERKQAQDLLQESEERYRTLVNQIPAVVYTDDSSGRMIFVSQQIETLLGFKQQEWIGGGIELWIKQIHHEDRDTITGEYQHLIQDGKSFEGEYRIHAKDGRLVWVQDKASIVRDEVNHTTSIQGIISDITERKQAERAIQQQFAELEMLYQSGLALNQLLKPREIAQKVIDLMGQKMDWHHITIRLYHPENETLELLAFNLPDNLREAEIRLTEDRFRSLIAKVGAGLTGWAVQHRQTVRIGELSQDDRYFEIVPGLHSGLYVPLQMGDRIVGVISVESEKPNAFNEADERLTTTLANQAAIALENARLHEETLRQVEQLQALHAIDLTISSSFNQNFTLDVLLSQAMKQLDTDAANILLMQPHQQTLKVIADKGFRGRGFEQTELKLNTSFAGRAILERRMIHVNAAELNTVQQTIAKVWSEEGFKSQHLMPLVSKGEVKGVLGVFFRRDFTSTPAWNNFLETLAGQAAIAIDNSQMFNGLQRANLELAVAYDATIEGWSQAMDLRDHETEGHTRRVTKMAIDLAEAMEMDDEELIQIRRGALLHDIGKIGVPDQILLKPDTLTDEEWQIMKRHPQLAYDMLGPINYLRRAVEIPYCHHEKWDGSGYPRGLKGEQIPLAARIFAVVDVWDAVTSDRPYRKAWDKADALKYIREQSGRHFDPEVVEVFLREFGNA